MALEHTNALQQMNALHMTKCVMANAMGETENVGIDASVQNMENSDIENAPKWE